MPTAPLRTSRQQTLPNLFGEHSLLAPQQRARWEGFALLWLDAHGAVRIGPTSSERPVVALLDAGSASAEFGFASRTARIDVDAGAIGLFLPGERKFTRWSCLHARRIVLDLDFQFLRDTGLGCEELLDAPLRQDLDFRDPELASVLRAMADEIAGGCPHGTLYAQSLSLGVARHLVARHGGGTRSERERGRLTPAQMRRIDELIDARIDASLSLPMMAAEAGFSASHFVRLLRNTAGCTPHMYLLRWRVRRACGMLVSSDLALVDIAQRTGFASQSHMSGVLRRMTGFAPGEIRRDRVMPGFVRSR